MLPRYDEFELTDSAYKHGFNDEDFAEVLRGPHLVVRNRRGKRIGYEVLGRNLAGAYLLAAGRVIQSEDRKVFRVFHLDRMTDAERRRFRRWLT
jgi:hypothetical protein